MKIAIIIYREDEGSHQQQNIGIGGVAISFAPREGPSIGVESPGCGGFFIRLHKDPFCYFSDIVIGKPLMLLQTQELERGVKELKQRHSASFS